MELEGQGWGIIMEVKRLLLLEPFYTIPTKRDQTFWRGVYNVKIISCQLGKSQTVSDKKMSHCVKILHKTKYICMMIL